MIYRVLGVLSLALGGIFGIVTLLVLLPFLDNFNFSLLILAGVFAVLAYVFLAIGLQLFHPPEGRRERASEHAEGVRAEAMIVAATSGAGAGPVDSGPVGSGPDPDVATRPAQPEATTRLAEPAAVPAADLVPVVNTAAPEIEAGEARHAADPVESVASPAPQTVQDHHESSNGGSPLGASTPVRAGFKKPGAVVPRD